MTPDELDSAIRQELRSAARLAPDPGPVRARVLTAALASQELPRRGLRAWSVPLLAAAAVLVALVLTTASQALRSEGRGDGTGGPAGSATPPAVSLSSTPVSATPTPPTSTAAARSGPRPSGTAAPSGTPTHRTGGGRTTVPTGPGPSAHADPVPQVWFHGLDATGLPHTPGLCPGGLRVDSVPGMGAPAISVPGEPAPLWLVPVSCAGATGDASPRPVEVFRSAPGGPQLVQTLAYQAGDPRSLLVTAIGVGAGSVTLSESGYHDTYDASCCRSLRFTQTYTWSAGHFEAGPQQDAVLPCTDGQLTIAGSWLPTADSTTPSGFLLVYTNHTDSPCQLTGYPSAVVSDSADPTPTDAARTPAGPLGGLTGPEAPRVILLGDVVGSAVVEWGVDQQAASRCWTRATVSSTPPGGLPGSSTFPDQPVVCDPQVHPVVYGSDGKQKDRGDR